MECVIGVCSSDLVHSSCMSMRYTVFEPYLYVNEIYCVYTIFVCQSDECIHLRIGEYGYVSPHTSIIPYLYVSRVSILRYDGRDLEYRVSNL